MSRSPRQLEPAKRVKRAKSVPALFAFAFEQASTRLASADVAALLRTDPGAVLDLTWIEPDDFDALSAYVDTLALRDSRARWSLRAGERAELVRLAGGDEALADGRRMFILAYAVDSGFAAAGAPPSDRSGGKAVRRPRAFLEDVTNAPPPLGQMTAHAACRRWMRTFWYIGRPGPFEAFGPLPKPAGRSLDDRMALPLEGAVDDESLRVAAVAWRRHGMGELDVRTSKGCFTVAGLKTAVPDGLVGRTIEGLADLRVHVAVLPELALDDALFEEFCDRLRERDGRYPCLTIVGRVHRPASSDPDSPSMNEAVVLDSTGSVVARHQKLEPFLQSGLLEDILPSQDGTYEFLDTPVGRLVLNVCRDVRSDVPMLMNRVIGTSLLLVPAYSKKLDFVREEAAVLGARQGTIVVAVNPPNPALEDLALLYVPLRGLDGRSTSQVSLDVVPNDADVVLVPWTVRIHGDGTGSLEAGEHRPI